MATKLDGKRRGHALSTLRPNKQLVVFINCGDKTKRFAVEDVASAIAASPLIEPDAHVNFEYGAEATINRTTGQQNSY